MDKGLMVTMMSVMSLIGLVAGIDIPHRAKTTDLRLALPDDKTVDFQLKMFYPLVFELELPEPITPRDICSEQVYASPCITSLLEASLSDLFLNMSSSGGLIELTACEIDSTRPNCEQDPSLAKKGHFPTFQKLFNDKVTGNKIWELAGQIIKSSLNLEKGDFLPITTVRNMFSHFSKAKIAKKYHALQTMYTVKQNQVIVSVIGSLLNYVSYQRIHEQLNICELGFIPVSRPDLDNKLEKLLEYFRFSGQVLAVSKLDDLFKYQVSDCIMNDKMLYVTISVPVYEPYVHPQVSRLGSITDFFSAHSTAIISGSVVLNYCFSAYLLFRFRTLIPVVAQVHAAPIIPTQNYDPAWEVIDDFELGVLIILMLAVIYLLRELINTVRTQVQADKVSKAKAFELFNGIDTKVADVAFRLNRL